LSNAGLGEFAQHVLREICSQEWVLELCLQSPEELFTPDTLLDNLLSPKQVIIIVRLVLVCFVWKSSIFHVANVIRKVRLIERLFFFF